MTGTDRAFEAPRVPCAVCRKEVPASEAVVPEAIDYLLYFCGLDCYETWLRQRTTPEKTDVTPRS